MKELSRISLMLFLALLVSDPQEAWKSLAEVLNHAIIEFARLQHSEYK